MKLKVAPGSLAAVKAVRNAFPDLLITLDANQSFSEGDRAELRAYDGLQVAWIEEPLATLASASSGRPGSGVSGRVASHDFSRLSQLQRTMATPICVDESFVDERGAYAALNAPGLCCFAVKAAKFGGIEPTLRFIHAARQNNCEVWMGGMYDTGISKRLHAALQTLPGVAAPGDVGAVSRYFDVDVTDPPYTVERGMVTLNRAGHEDGLGCELCRPALERVLVERVVVE